jgi:uncharacterized membrane protein YcaP (DUF421 family)
VTRMTAIFRAILGYYFLVFIMRVVGRRPGRQMTPMEFVLIFFSGGLTLTAIVADERSITNALCQIMAIAVAHYFLAWIRQKSPAIGRIVDGTPMVLLQKGQWHIEAMDGTLIKDDDVMAAARERGLETLDQIDYAVYERSGEISVIPRSEE